MRSRVDLTALRSLIGGARRRRLQIGWSQETLARHAGLHRNTVRLLESGDVDPSATTTVRLLVAVGASGFCVCDTCALPCFGQALDTDRADVDALCGQLGPAIRALRERIGWTIEHLAEQSNVHHNSVGMIERSEVHTETSTLIRLLRALDVNRLGWEPDACATRLRLH